MSKTTNKYSPKIRARGSDADGSGSGDEHAEIGAEIVQARARTLSDGSSIPKRR